MALTLHANEVDELKELISLNAFADEVLETCIRDRLSLKRSLERFLPQVGERMGAIGGVVITRDEELNDAAFSWGELGGGDAWTLLSKRPDGIHKIGERYLLCQELDVAGVKVGSCGFIFGDDVSKAKDVMLARLDTVCEELDAILSTVHTASEKQELVLRINRALSNRVFETGLDDAVEILHTALAFTDFVFVWQDAVAAGVVYYRVYRANGKLAFDSENNRHPGLDLGIKTHGADLLSPTRNRLRAVMGMEGAIETVLLSGATESDWLGKVLVRGDGGGFSTFALDLVRLLAEKARDRLLDHNRERRHLSQFFPAKVINQLLREPAYNTKYLKAREEKIAILYADINSFTKISELILEKPSLIGAFVDKWSEGAVNVLWKHGGTFDKMVGDCIIGLFGPPFYADAPELRAIQALRAAKEILDFTIQFENDETMVKVKGHELVKGLGVAVGVNLCPAFVGTFGPNQDMTAFSSGMNSTARLQSLAGYREILAMDSVVEAVKGMPEAKEFNFGPLTESPVKNVLKPLRHSKVT